MPLMNACAMSQGIEDMRFQELSSNVEVAAEDYEDYTRVIAKSLSSGHDAIIKKVVDFMGEAARRSQNAAARAQTGVPASLAQATVTSSFPPFEFKVASGEDIERIVIELTVRSGGGVFHVASKKIRNCNQKSGRRTQEAVPSEAVARPEDISEGRRHDERFPGYYNAVKSSLTKNRTRSQHNYFAGKSNGKGSEDATCRICFDSQCPIDDSFDLIHPCNCNEPVHIECLRRWQHVQIEQAAQPSKEAAAAKAATCEICGALLCLDGNRVKPPTKTAICRPDALEPIANGAGKKDNHSRGMKVPLRRFPASTHAPGAFSGTSVENGQELEILEQDASGDFYRVRVLNASRYQDPQGPKLAEGTVASAQGWIQHVYLEWPGNVLGSWAHTTSHPQNPPCNPLLRL